METTIEESFSRDDTWKEATRKLIAEACGPRSLSEFAKACGISPAHICRIKNGKAKPTKKMCIKMANEFYVRELGITCSDFFVAAGINETMDIEIAQKYENVVSKQNETRVLGTITKKLMESRYTYQLLPVSDDQDVNFAFLVVNGRKKTRWNFVLNQEYLECGNCRSINASYYNLGRLLSFSPSVDEQHTIICENEEAYDQLVKMVNPDQVLAKVSVVLLDNEQMSIKKEAMFGPEKISMSLSDDN